MRRRRRFALGAALAVVACQGNGEERVGAGGAGAGAGGAGPGGGPSEAAAIVINELMIDPAAVSDGQGEWVELFNPGATPVDLGGWTLSDEGSNEHVIDGLVIAPGGYVVLGRTTDTGANGGAPVDQGYGEAFSLAQGGDSVRLTDGSGQLIDEIRYEPDDAWPAVEAGVSLELTSPSLDNALGSSWTLATAAYGAGDRGTPGAPNGAVEGVTVTPATSWHQPSLNASVFFAPYDDLATLVEDQIERATTSIDVAMFHFRRDQVKDALIAKHQAGVKVRVVADAFQQNMSGNDTDEQLVAAGVPVTLIDNDASYFAAMHHKVMVVDGQTVLVGSANYTTTGLTDSDEQILVTDNADLAARFTTEIDEMIADTDAPSPSYPSSADVRAWMGPEDDLAGKVLEAFQGATTSIYVSMYHFSYDPFATALIDAKNDGVRVVVVVDAEQANNPSTDVDEQLVSAGVPVIYADNDNSAYAITHHKYAVIDHARVLMGSYNWTTLATEDNDENLVVIDDPQIAVRFEGNFGLLLGQYGQGATSYGLEGGPKNVTFSVGNVALEEGAQLEIEPLDGPLGETILPGTQGTLSLPSGARVTYRYRVRKGEALIAVEPGSHSFTVPYAPGPFTVSDALVP